MPAPFQGGCCCGAIRYEASMERMAVMNCHCRDCQYASGGGFSTVAVLPATAFRLLQGAPRAYASKGDSGADVSRSFCETCGTPLFSTPPGGALAVVKAATLDDPSWLRMNGALYVASAQPWAYIDPNLPSFPRMPPGAPGVQ